MTKKVVIIGVYGPTLDKVGNGKKGPTLCLCSLNKEKDSKNSIDHVDEFHLIYQEKYKKQKNNVEKLKDQCKTTKMILHPVYYPGGPWNFSGVFQTFYNFLKDFNNDYSFDFQNVDYYIHISTGTITAKICWFILIMGIYKSIKLIQSIPPDTGTNQTSYTNNTLDPHLKEYADIQELFQKERSERADYVTENKSYKTQVEEILQDVHYMSNSEDRILLIGETGVGKTRLVDKICEAKFPDRTKKEHYVKLNCATLVGGTAMSTLFGHKKGAFTGAVEDYDGKIKEADDGLLFLDEIGELGLQEQAMLLKAIDEKKYLRVGGGEEQESHFFLVCATNRDLEKEVAEKRFRHDLLARINGWTFMIPPLRKRPEDLTKALDDLLENTEKKIDQDAHDAYLKFARSPKAVWKDNFRDLSKSVRRMVVKSGNKDISIEVVRKEIKDLESQWESHSATFEKTDLRNDPLFPLIQKHYSNEIDDLDLVQLLYVIKICRQSNSLAKVYQTVCKFTREEKKTTNDSDRLSKYLKEYNLTFAQIKKFVIDPVLD